MNWFNRLKVAIRFENYGYWVGPDGDEHDVIDSAGHYSTIKRLGFDGYDDAWNQNWIRVVTDRMWGKNRVQCGCNGSKAPTRAQAIKLIKIFKEHLCEGAYIELPGASHREVPEKDISRILMGIVQDAQPVPKPPPAPVAPPKPEPVPVGPPTLEAPGGKLTREQLQQARQQARQRVNPNLQRAR